MSPRRRTLLLTELRLHTLEFSSPKHAFYLVWLILVQRFLCEKFTDRRAKGIRKLSSGKLATNDLNVSNKSRHERMQNYFWFANSALLPVIQFRKTGGALWKAPFLSMTLIPVVPTRPGLTLSMILTDFVIVIWMINNLESDNVKIIQILAHIVYVCHEYNRICILL